MSNLDFRFNGGNGTVLCNKCRVMLCDTADRSKQIECAHLCDKCWDYVQILIEEDKKLKFGSNPF